MSSHALLKAVRKTHHYLGVFIAPAVLFFAFTGFLQTFSLHESTKGSPYVPPAILVRLSQLHKKATLTVPERKPGPPPAARPEATAPKPAPAPPSPPQSFHWPEKLFFGFVAVGLFTSTSTGLYMAWKYTRRKILVGVTFVAGIIIPLILLPF
jgi:hypothetical protein